MLLGAIVGFAGSAAAQDDATPELAFLEYLGSWADSDEEWVVVAEEFMGSPGEDPEPVPEALGDEPSNAGEEDGEPEETDAEETDED